MSTTPQDQPSPIPAQLGFLAIYNPALSTSDATVSDQIVYYSSLTPSHHSSSSSSSKPKSSRSSKSRSKQKELTNDEKNERLRQVGLAQAMVSFSKSFSLGKPVDTIDTAHARVILHELEPGWWILVSVDLTRLPKTDGTTEYSSREVKSAGLLLKEVLRAHWIWLLHHGSSLSSVWVRMGQEGFESVLGGYWDRWVDRWEVLLEGNPAVGMVGGIKVAACGELGMGVGEEDRGSGERSVLEGMRAGMEGLVDVVVGRYDGEIGMGKEVGSEDGAVFLGTGQLSRESLRAVVGWMEDVYMMGDGAYGVGERPGEKRRRRKRRAERKGTVTKLGEETIGKEEAAGAGMDKLFSYLKIGYGTSWSLTGSTATEQAPQETTEPNPPKPLDVPIGRFLIGLMGSVDGSLEWMQDPKSPQEQDPDGNSRTVVRTVYVELESEAENRPTHMTKDLGSQDTELAESVSADGQVTEAQFDSQDRNKTKMLRVVVYAAEPFIFVFLFQPRTDSLEFEAFYRSLHNQITPILKPLRASTAYRPERPDTGSGASGQIYDLVWDPIALTVHSTIPNIPEPASVGGPGGATQTWSRAEALNTHNQILNVFAATRENLTEYERTCKTSRGWWVVWNRIPEQGGRREESPSRRGSDENETEDAAPGSMQDLTVYKEIFLVRRASDHAARSVSLSSPLTGGGGWADGASRLAQGIGVDTRRYIEGLLSLNR